MPTDNTKADDKKKDEKDEKPWEASRRGKKGADAAAKKLAKDESEEDEDCEDEDEEEMDKGKKAKKSGTFRDDLNKAIKLLAAHSEENDPSLRREALLAKELRGGGLTKSERQELIAHLDDGPPADGLGDQVLRHVTPSAHMSKAMAGSQALADSHDGLTKSLALFADKLEKSQREQNETLYLMARLVAKTGEAVEGQMSELHERHNGLEKSLEAIGRQPLHAPRSVGVAYREKSFGGGGTGGAEQDPIEKSSRAKLQKALGELAEAEPSRSDMKGAFQMASLGLRINRPLVPKVAERLREHLAASQD